MNERIKKRWIKELRHSGIAQGDGVLAENVKGQLRMCALGILCAIHNGEVSPTVNNWTIAGYKHEHIFYLEMSSTLPGEVMDWAGLYPSDISEITRLNDLDQRPFPYIAKWIQNHL